MSIDPKSRIAIIGGGPGGLTLARLLQNQGATVKVYERDVERAARVQGATLNINAGSGLLAIERCGLMDRFRKVFRPGAEAMVIADKSGQTILDDFGGGREHEERPEIDRGPLRDLLLDSLHEDTVVWNSRFLSLSRKKGAIELELDGGKSAVADLVVASDGSSSRVRPYLTSVKPDYSGVMIVEGVVYDLAAKLPKIHAQLNGGKIMALGDDKTLAVVLKGDGTAAFYCGLRAPADSLGEPHRDFKAWFREEFRGWESWAGLFDESDLFIRRPQYCAPPDQTWEAQRDLTMIGDAAHVMPPYAGEGVNMAMLDAVELTDALVTHSNPHDAIAAFESKMRERMSEAAKETMEFTRIFHSPEAIPFFVSFFQQAQG